jgi:hypothetical protein
MLDEQHGRADPETERTSNVLEATNRREHSYSKGKLIVAIPAAMAVHPSVLVFNDLTSVYSFMGRMLCQANQRSSGSIDRCR